MDLKEKNIVETDANLETIGISNAYKKEDEDSSDVSDSSNDDDSEKKDGN